MKKILIFLLFALSWVIPSFGESKILRLAVFQLEPFTMEDPSSGKVTGAAVDYWKEFIGPSLGYTIQVLGLYPSNRVMVMLERGEIDVAPVFTKIPEREKKFLFPKNHLYEVESCLMVLPDSKIEEIRVQTDLYGKRIGYLEGAYIPDLLIHPMITIELVSNTDYRQINYNKLINGRIDAWLDINRLSLQYFLSGRNYEQNVRLVPLPTEKSKIFSIFRKTAEGERLRGEFEKMNAEGIRMKIFEGFLKKYLDQN